MTVLWIILAIFIGLQAYIRFAPTSASAWTIDATDRAPGDYPSEGGFMAVRRVAGDSSTFLHQFEAALLAEPRTAKLGDADGQHIYVARSAFWGFPDYVTVDLRDAPGGGRATVYSRLRFGKGDMGVNAKRIKRVLDRMGSTVQG